MGEVRMITSSSREREDLEELLFTSSSTELLQFYFQKIYLEF